MTEREERIYNFLEEKVDEILLQIQDELNIECRDITPTHEDMLHTFKHHLSGTIEMTIKSQMENNESMLRQEEEEKRVFEQSQNIEITKEELIDDILKYVKHKRYTNEEFREELKKQSMEDLRELWVKAIESF